MFDISKVLILEFCSLYLKSRKRSHDEIHPRPLLAILRSSGLIKKANVVGEDELVNEYLLCKIGRLNWKYMKKKKRINDDKSAQNV